MKNICVVFGGVSSEHEVSVVSAQCFMAGIRGCNVVSVYITRDGRWLMYDGKAEGLDAAGWERLGTPAVLSPDRYRRGLMRLVGDKVKIVPVDVVVPILHGRNGEDGTIQGLCELAGIPYVGCGVMSSAVCMDKAIFKAIVAQNKIPQGEYLVFKKEALETADGRKDALRTIGRKLRYPCFVKPAVGGSSVGVTKVHTRKELSAAIDTALAHDDKILVEKAIVGREIELAVLGKGATAQVSGAGEILSGDEFYDYAAKYENPASQTVIPAELPDDVLTQLQKYALAIFDAVDGSGLARVDFFVDENNRIFLNEVNTLPGFTPISMYMKLWEHAGVSREELVARLLDV